MGSQTRLSFSPEVAEKLNFYVYRLIDPRNGETFYVGKGKGNRVFAHSEGKAASSNENPSQSEKLELIHEIRAAGLEVTHVIHRHGLDEAAAFEVEGALLDVYPGLRNQIKGHGSSNRGVMHVQQIIEQYGAMEAVFSHRAVLITINRTAGSKELIDATRYAWKLDPNKAKQAEVVLAVVDGIIRGAFIADEWLPATREHFPGFQERPGRWGFQGREAPKDLAERYVGKRVPADLKKKGSANPIRYVLALPPR